MEFFCMDFEFIMFVLQKSENAASILKCIPNLAIQFSARAKIAVARINPALGLNDHSM